MQRQPGIPVIYATFVLTCTFSYLILIDASLDTVPTSRRYVIC